MTPRRPTISYGRNFSGQEGRQPTLRHLQGSPPDARHYPADDDQLTTQDLPYDHRTRNPQAPAGVRAFDAEKPGHARNTPVRSFHNPATGLPVPYDTVHDLARRGLTEDQVIYHYEPYVPPAVRPRVVREAQTQTRRELVRRARRGTL